MHVSSRYVINLGERAVTIKIIYFIFHFHSKCMRSGEYYKSCKIREVYTILYHLEKCYTFGKIFNFSSGCKECYTIYKNITFLGERCTNVSKYKEIIVFPVVTRNITFFEGICTNIKEFPKC